MWKFAFNEVAKVWELTENDLVVVSDESQDQAYTKAHAWGNRLAGEALCHDYEAKRHSALASQATAESEALHAVLKENLRVRLAEQGYDV